MKAFRGEYLVMMATFFAAVGWVSSKQVVMLMPAAQFIGLRFVLAALILLPFCYSAIKRLTVRLCLFAFSVGLVLALHLLLWIYAVSISDSLGEGAFIMSLAMLFAPLVAWLLGKGAPPASFWCSLPIAVSGMALLSLSGGWQVSVGQLYFLLSALLLSLHFNLNKSLTARVPALVLVCIQLFAVGLVSLAVSYFYASGESAMTVSGWSWFVVAALLATSLRYFLQTEGQSRIDTGLASVLMIMEPVWTLLFSVLMFSESLSVSKVGGCLLILSALLVYRFAQKKHSDKTELAADS